MVKLLATAAGLGLLFVSTAAASAPASKQAKPAERQYCITFSGDTGSHLKRTECRTKSQWKQLGVDVDELIQN
jgi:hypothetical protein